MSRYEAHLPGCRADASAGLCTCVTAADRLRALADAATPGKWEVITGPTGKPMPVAHTDRWTTDLYLGGPDGDLIALSPDMARLLADSLNALAESLQHPDHVSDEVRKERNRHALALLAEADRLLGQ